MKYVHLFTKEKPDFTYFLLKSLPKTNLQVHAENCFLLGKLWTSFQSCGNEYFFVPP